MYIAPNSLYYWQREVRISSEEDTNSLEDALRDEFIEAHNSWSLTQESEWTTITCPNPGCFGGEVGAGDTSYLYYIDCPQCKGRGSLTPAENRLYYEPQEHWGVRSNGNVVVHLHWRRDWIKNGWLKTERLNISEKGDWTIPIEKALPRL